MPGARPRKPKLPPRPQPLIEIPNGIKLSPCQHKVLRFLVFGLANKDIAVQLGISERTTKFHVSNLIAKFHHVDRRVFRRLDVAMLCKFKTEGTMDENVCHPAACRDELTWRKLIDAEWDKALVAAAEIVEQATRKQTAWYQVHARILELRRDRPSVRESAPYD